MKSALRSSSAVHEMAVSVVGRPGSGRRTLIDRLGCESNTRSAAYSRKAIVDVSARNGTGPGDPASDELRLKMVDPADPDDLSDSDAALIVIDATSTVSAADRSLFDLRPRRTLPVCIFVNKWDATAWNARELVDAIRTALLVDPAPVNWPVMEDGRIHGLLSVRAGSVRGVGPPPQGHSVASARRSLRSICAPTVGDVEGHISGHGPVPLLFGSALHRFGVDDLCRALHRQRTV